MATRKEAKTLSKQKKAHEKYMASLEPGEKRVKRQSERSRKATEKGKTAKATRISDKMRKEAYEGSDFQKRQDSSRAFAKEERASRAVEAGDKKAVRRSGADKATIKAGVKEIKADNKKKKATKTKSKKDPLAYEDKKATRQRNRDVASDNRQGRRKAGRAAKKQAMEDFSPATQKHVVTKEEMKEGRKRAYLADQAAKAKKQKKADITEMDMDQAKMKAYKEANPDKYKNAANSPAKQRAEKKASKKIRKDYKKLTKATNKIGEGSDKKDVRQAKKMVKMEEKIANSPAKMYEGDMHSFDQMDSKNAMATAGEGPIKYFKQKINYDIKEASNSNLSQSARNNYAKNAQHDMKSMGKKYGSMAHMDGSMKGDSMAKKKGSVLSKHFRK